MIVVLFDAAVAVGIQDMSSALRRAVKRSVSEPEDAGDETEGDSGANEEESAPDNQSILRRLEENEKVSQRPSVLTLNTNTSLNLNTVAKPKCYFNFMCNYYL